ncbi:sirohydrochlorin chelatase [methanotrophic endosymbiont of Bathymodiolus puteoserpentis (Logatchev)]|jgi:sirohydrochlorin cobaltochelatase|uniref:sirohydrochlorin chelatase n=1 Tax=methanotrophic endosymbiont of Bathymodiolus puteoserpentis (Logatchev) TaxID=343235 RepID=UPI0013CB0B41|nr:sirohydrochlorin chelatase [methanotrophic endosymbiont of Bathymodiolus puteoserpentis (Logatchev)]SHE23043.1 Sirohydrochlorin cobaltochelatase [methanotrophic endosymbiont of Bathymodiolus puteoserpentis (Logatchev)]
MEYSILLVGHGSRAKQGNVEIEAFADQWRTLHPEWLIDVCFIEFADVLLDAGFDLAAKKSKKVIVVPLILNAAGHVKMEVPEHLAEARKRHPDVEFLYAPHLGANEAILSIMKRSLLKVMAGLDMPDPKSTGVIILGRGSSDKIANGEVAKMARWLWEETQHELVDIAFTGITFPRLESAVQRQVKLGMTQVCVLPYYLFTGTLIERIDKQVAHLQAQYPQIRFGLGKYFGFEPEIFATLDERVLALLEDKPTKMMECDGCHYRQIAQEHGHGHEH